MTESQLRQLVVMRHSKTEQYAGSDHARRLTERGVGDALAAGRWLREIGVAPDIVLVSSAARAVTTAEKVVDALAKEPDTRVLDELYGATAADVVELCAGLDPGVRCVAVIGHNPTMAMLAQDLVGDEQQIGHFPTSAVAVLELADGWDSLGNTLLTVRNLHTPHDA